MLYIFALYNIWTAPFPNFDFVDFLALCKIQPTCLVACILVDFDGVAPVIATCGLGSVVELSPPRFLAECCKRQLNQGSFVLLYFRLFTFSDLYWVCLYFPVLFCLSVSVKWLAVKIASEMTYRPIVSSGALNSTPTNQAPVLCGNDSLSSSCRHTCTAVYIFNSHMINFLCYRYHLYYFYCFA